MTKSSTSPFKMASFARFTSFLRRRFSTSSILDTKGLPFLTSKQKSRTALSMIKSEKNPERIVQICRDAFLTPDSHIDCVTYGVAVSKLSESRSFATIREFIEEQKSRPDLKNERFMSKAIILYGKSGMLDQAIRTFDQMGDLKLTRTTKSLNALLISCIIDKKYKEVSRIFQEFPETYDINPDIDTYNIMIRSFCLSGSSSLGFSLLEEMESKRGCKPNGVSYATLLAGFYKEEKFDEAGKVLELMAKNGHEPNVNIYNVRIQSLCKLGKSVEAKTLLDEMMKKGIKPKSNTYYYLIYGFCKESNLREAKGLFAQMKKKQCVPDGGCYFALIYYLCRGGDFDSALELCKESMAKDWIPNFSSMKALVNGLVSNSKVEEARDLIGKIKEKFSDNADMWTTIEEGLPQ